MHLHFRPVSSVDIGEAVLVVRMVRKLITVSHDCPVDYSSEPTLRTRPVGGCYRRRSRCPLRKLVGCDGKLMNVVKVVHGAGIF